MFEEYKICPYTGLRPFTEDESIYFKGRDGHIEQATRQLEKNKFIMLTGASGDGKSSLVYAGIIPNAKAGFLKASFSNWAVVDFRPERKPLANFSKALASQLSINAEIVRTELSYGFSALVDMYKASSLYYDTNEPEWLEGDELSKNEKRRKASNLIILADQFEEFFTNPENFQKGIPSREAMSVTNLLLETARIALEENLPIYVIITMRSDFIGQCAAFRGLPEYIGFSQFFVPRLNRKELREVIEEPAWLSGNKISRRLTERLIHDIVEGTDQLPILQHALNQIWTMADEGRAEMDLIHYVMVGGMEGSELPEEDAKKFSQWFESLPKKIQNCYNQPGLQNVLNTHANKLYNQATDYLKENKKEAASDDDAKMIIRTAFKCLTKIDTGRAVRNRMTLEEITAIINEPHLNTKKVGNVLDIFREPGNTLLRPFLEDVPELNKSDVLDITHESLIRNWKDLEDWANEEFNSYTISLDFGQQLNRWIESGKSNDFLLSIGPLTYFEDWIKKTRPNVAWIARYLKDDLDKLQKTSKAQSIQNTTNEFLRRSARKHLVTRTIMRYGPKKIAAVLAAVVLITFSSFGVRNYLNQKNVHVLKEIKAQTLQLAGSKNVLFMNKLALLCEALKFGETTFPEIVRSISDPFEKMKVARGITSILIYQGIHEPKEKISEGLAIADSLLENYTVNRDHDALSGTLSEMVSFSAALELGYYYNQSDEIDSVRNRNAERLARGVMSVFKTQSSKFQDVNSLNLALEYAIHHRMFSIPERQELINLLSPWEKTTRTDWVMENYKKDKQSPRGTLPYSFNFNGLYQELAHLYASIGNFERSLQAIDTLLHYNQTYYLNDYATMAENAASIAVTFYRYGHLKSLDEFVNGYCLRRNSSQENFYARLLGWTKVSEFAADNLHIYPWMDDVYMNLNLLFSDREQLAYFYSRYREVVSQTEQNEDARNYYLSISYKNEGIQLALRNEFSQQNPDLTKPAALFEKAVNTYKKISSLFLEEQIRVIGTSAANEVELPRKYIFLFPDHRTPFHPFEPRSFHFMYMSPGFLNYIIDHDLFAQLYPTGEELRYIEGWLQEYNSIMFQPIRFVRKPLSRRFLISLEHELSKRGAHFGLDLNLLYLYLLDAKPDQGHADSSLYYFSKINPNILLNGFGPRLFGNIINSHSLYMVARALKTMTITGRFSDASKMLQAFKNPINRSSVYACAAVELLQEKSVHPGIQQLIDSSRAEMLRVKNLSSEQPNRVLLALAMILQNGNHSTDDAYKIIKNVAFKQDGVGRISQSIAFHNELYNAYRQIPMNTSDNDAALFLWNILHGYVRGQQIGTPGWETFNENILWRRERLIQYVDEGR